MFRSFFLICSGSIRSFAMIMKIRRLMSRIYSRITAVYFWPPLSIFSRNNSLLTHKKNLSVMKTVPVVPLWSSDVIEHFLGCSRPGETFSRASSDNKSLRRWRSGVMQDRRKQAPYDIWQAFSVYFKLCKHFTKSENKAAFASRWCSPFCHLRTIIHRLSNYSRAVASLSRI